MHPFEIITLVTVAASFLAYAFPRRPRWLALGLPLTALAFVFVQLLAEGYRWQMLPLYALAGGLGLAALLGSRRPGQVVVRGRLCKQIAGSAAGLLLTALAAALPVLLPVPQAPAPTGPYQVGTFSMMLVDASRTELYSGNPGEPRRFMVQFWYPAAPGPQARLEIGRASCRERV
jgi:hypothetical protein